MHRLVAGHAGIDRVEEADELLMPVLLHVPPDHGAIEDVERGIGRGGAVALVIMGHGAEPSFLERQSRLGPVERLNLAFLVEGQHDGVRRRIDIKPDHIVEFIRKLRVIRQLELPEAVRLGTVRYFVREAGFRHQMTNLSPKDHGELGLCLGPLARRLHHQAPRPV